MPSGLRNVVRLALYKLFRIDLPLQTITDYFKRWDFTPQRPVKSAYEQNLKKVARWFNTVYPTTANRAHREKADIYWDDETGIRNNAYNVRGFSPKGEAPVVRLNAKKACINIISALTNSGTVRFKIYRETMTAKALNSFMPRKVKDTNC